MPYRRAKVTKRGPVTVEHYTDQQARHPISTSPAVQSLQALRKAARLQTASNGRTTAPCGSPK